MFGQRGNHVSQKFMLTVRIDMLKHVERVGPILLARHGTREHVVHKSAGKRPFEVHALFHVFYEHCIEINDRHSPDRLLDDSRAERIGASDLEDCVLAGEHFCDELIAGKGKGKTFGIVPPSLIYHQTEWRKPVSILDVQNNLILRLSGVL